MSRDAVSIDRARALLSAFDVTPRQVAPLGKGLINDTFAVSSDRGELVLQRVHPVFSPAIHHNIVAVTDRLVARGMETPRLLPGVEGRPWVERDGEVWRLMTRIAGVSFDAADDPAQAHAAARLLGRFHSALDGLDHEFVGLRTGVHDTPAHLRRLHEAVQQHPEHPLFAEVAPLAEAITRGAEALPPLTGLPDRIVHGDPKLNNVIFASGTGPGRTDARCWIDLDTVAPMPLAVELGDAWRSWCNPRGEDDHEARFDLTIFEASLRGYSEGCSLAVTPEEREALLHGVEWITLELSARFAADALFESYFGWDRQRYGRAGEHNLVRARGQWSLHQAVLASRSARQAALQAATAG